MPQRPDQTGTRPRKAPSAPARLRAAAELPGLDVLRALDDAPTPVPEALGVALWRALGAVHLWADTPAPAREGLFPPHTPAVARLAHAAAAAPELADALAMLARLYAAPHLADREGVAQACRGLRDWADERGLLVPALHFAEAAASAEPRNPQWAMEAGRLCWRIGGAELMQRAEQWLDRACALASVARRRRRLMSIRAYLSYGEFLKQIGRFDDARQAFVSAGRRARSHDRWYYVAVSEHNLLLLEAEAGRHEEALRHARAALDHYARRSDRLPELVHDVAYLLNSLGHFYNALDLLIELPAKIQRPADRMIVYSSLAWAAAGAGNRALYHDARESASRLTGTAGEFQAGTHLHLAHAAIILGERQRALHHASAALEAASRQWEWALKEEAGKLIEQIHGNREMGTPQTSRREDIDRMITLLHLRMEGWKPRRRNPP